MNPSESSATSSDIPASTAALDRRGFLGAISGLAALAMAGEATAQPATPENRAAQRTDVFDFDRTFQTIENFSASDCWSCEPAGLWEDEAAKNRIADLLFSIDKGIGLTAWRINLGGGIDKTMRNPHRTVDSFETAPGQYDFGKCPGQQWFAQAAKARGVTEFIAFVNSPPIRMTVSGHTYGPKEKNITTNLKPGSESDFAVYLADIVEHFQNAPEPQRIPFTHLSPINEPDIPWDEPNQEGCRYSVEDIRRTLKPVAAEISRRGLKVQMVAPETNKAHSLIEDRHYFDGLARHEDTRDILHQRLCYHSYDVVKFEPQAVTRRRKIGEELATLPGWTLWMSEYCVLEHGRDLTMDTALRLARLMHFDLTEANATAWQWWLGLSFGDYKDGIVYADLKTREVMPSKMLWVMGQYSRFVRPGARRIALAAENEFETSVLASAYRHDGDRRAACVYVNIGDEPATVTPVVRSDNGVAFSEWQIHRTSDVEGEDIRFIQTAAQNSSIPLPGRSVTTLTCDWT